MKCSLSILVTTTVLAVVGCSQSNTETDSIAPVDFAMDIRPLLETNCLACHHGEVSMGGLNLQYRDGAFAASDRGTSIVPGDPDSSLIYTMTAIRHGKQDEVMPADGVMLTEAQRKLLHRWIKEGAHWPAGEDGVLKPLTIQPGKA
ncbi:MAG: c-type cytochrome domain-containing protein [Verrucomicrobiales bacterium]